MFCISGGFLGPFSQSEDIHWLVAEVVGDLDGDRLDAGRSMGERCGCGGSPMGVSWSISALRVVLSAL